MKILNNHTVKLCCGGNGCPIVEDLKNGYIKITDDNGSSVTVKKEEADLLPGALSYIKSNESTAQNPDEKLILG